MTMSPRVLNSAFVYVDEAGDLGWKFNAPLGKGGSSRYLTISAVFTPEKKSDLPRRFVRTLYQKFGWSQSVEHKWCSMDVDQKSLCAVEMRELCESNPDIFLHAIVVKKQNVMSHIRSDSNELYNYMIRLALLERMSKHDAVMMIPDPRSVKMKSSNSLRDYLQTELWFTKKSKTNLVTWSYDSASCKESSWQISWRVRFRLILNAMNPKTSGRFNPSSNWIGCSSDLAPAAFAAIQE
jgi:hypothetical protein